MGSPSLGGKTRGSYPWVGGVWRERPQGKADLIGEDRSTLPGCILGETGTEVSWGWSPVQWLGLSDSTVGLWFSC